MAVQEKLYTADDLWELSTLPENADRHFELIEGELIEVAPSSAVPTLVTVRITRIFDTYVSDHDLGYVTGSEGAFQLAPKTVLVPDVAFIAKGRLAEIPDRYFLLAPDLVIEVVSPTDRIKAAQRKAAKYIAFGTRLVWIVYPQDKTVDVFRPSEQGTIIEEVGIDGVLDGGDVVQGFTLPIKDMFRGHCLTVC